MSPLSIQLTLPASAVNPRLEWSLVDLNRELDEIEASLRKTSGSQRTGSPEERVFTPLLDRPEYSLLRERLHSDGNASNSTAQSKAAADLSPAYPPIGVEDVTTPIPVGLSREVINDTTLDTPVQEHTPSILGYSSVGNESSSSAGGSWKKSSFDVRRGLSARKPRSALKSHRSNDSPPVLKSTLSQDIFDSPRRTVTPTGTVATSSQQGGIHRSHGKNSPARQGGEEDGEVSGGGEMKPSPELDAPKLGKWPPSSVEGARKLESRLLELEAKRVREFQGSLRVSQSELHRALLQEELRRRGQEREVEEALGEMGRREREQGESYGAMLRGVREEYGRAVKEAEGGREGIDAAAAEAREKREREERERREREEREKKRAEEQARLERERKAKEEEERKRRLETEQRTKLEQQEKDKQEQMMLQRQRQEQEALQKRKEEERRVKQEGEQKAAAEQQRKAQEEKEEKEKSKRGGVLPPWATIKGSTDGVEFRSRGSLQALEQARDRELRRAEWEQEAAAYRNDPSQKSQRREVERALVKLVQQISATQDQVRRKSQDIVGLLSRGGAPRGYLLVAFSEKVMAQAQACKLPTVAFALAQVLVNVDTQIPGVLEAIFGALNKACMYTVPKQFAMMSRDDVSEADTTEFLRVCGYEESGVGVGQGQLEPTDLYVERIVGCCTLLGAVLQATPAPMGVGGGGGGGQGGPMLGLAWQWCAVLLNHLNPDRCSAAALEGFLKVAGHGLSRRYPRPFSKLLQATYQQFIPALKQLQDPDVSPVVTRLAMYIEGRKYERPPEGSQMPKTDISSSLRA